MTPTPEVPEEELVYDAPDGILDIDNMKTGENLLTQIDPYCQYLLESNLWDFETKTSEGTIIRVKGRLGVIPTYNADGSVDKIVPHFYENQCKYPKILNAYAWAASHLNKNLNLPQHMAFWLMEEWEGKFMDPLELEYSENGELITLLDAIDSILKRNLVESIDGSGQNYNIQMSGSHRTVEQITRPKQQ